MQKADRNAIATAAALGSLRPTQTTTPVERSRVGRAWPAVVQLWRTWRERELQRRELSTMSPRDFGDLAVPPSLLKEELRRWPWQKPSQQWSQIKANRGAQKDAMAGPDELGAGFRHRRDRVRG